ncbi:hypothetical protein BS47DRAFT_1097647 [Hydnum rufescens UP504]|uniref:Serine racemase n=1 Tax=Hydnum rufescens UP504 TaxID=1448309 RepID=A0A9P6AVI5_9AGAM|nr:hypothetical protein BS47DRAFT_1097647 [Hydnum rufescens UP504]
MTVSRLVGSMASQVDMDPSSASVTLSSIQSALNDIQPFIHRTPVITSSTIDCLCHMNILMKCENFQKVGAFKIRGATYAIHSILSRGINPVDLTVVTHSSGNHAQALALAARQMGVRCHVVMPLNAPSVKKEAVQGYGAVVTFCEGTQAAREETSKLVMKEEVLRAGGSGVVEFVSPYNDTRIVTGQGTIAVELLSQATDMHKPLDILVTPVGGGGMLAGCSLAAKALNPSIQVIGAEPLGADDAYRSFHTGSLQPSTNPMTIADGLRTSLGSITYPIIMKFVDSICTVSDEGIIRAMRLVYERVKVVIEPSAAVPLAVVLYSEEFKVIAKTVEEGVGRKPNVGIVFSGGNVELDKVLALFASLDK